MKNIILILAFYFVSFIAMGQQEYWQQELRYHINVSLNDKANTLTGKLDLVYINHSPDTLQYIWFNVWPNGYSSKQSALAKQLKDKKEFNKWFSEENKGYINQMAFTVNSTPVTYQPDTNVDNIKVPLPSPLVPGDSVRIQTPFFVKLPLYFSRSGHHDNQFMITQWYPKPAVYDSLGWHPMPYLDHGEFYSEYGSFDVNITIPSAYVVGATGELQTKEELEVYKSIGARNLRQPDNKILYKPSTASLKTLHYTGSNIHDFAWFANKKFLIRYDTLQLASGKLIDAFSYSQENGNREWRNSVQFIEDAVRYYSSWIGEYPYPTVAAVEGPRNQSSGGMEYPMITLITSPEAGAEGLDAVIAHEVGHNWFYGILGSNERDHPWMDEGINSFFEFMYEAVKYRSNTVFGAAIPAEVKKLPVTEFLGRVYNALNTIPAAKPIATASAAFDNEEEYGAVAYLKTAIWLYIVEAQIGEDAMLKGMQRYFTDWKFRHPSPQDFQRSLEAGSGKDLSELFRLLNKEGNF